MKNNKFILTTTFVLLAFMLVFVYIDLKNRFEFVENEKYKIISKSIKERVLNLVSDKQSSTLAISLTLSQNSDIISSLRGNDFDTLPLEKISKDLRSLTDYKNVWIQILSPKGVSLYRSWTQKRGDNLYDIRADLRELIRTKQLNSTISVGIFSMTFKSMVPIYYEDEFIGIIEIITHFNSIAKKLQQDKIQSLVLVDKKFKQQLTNPITKEFIEDYYVATFENDPNLKSLINSIGVEEILKADPYLIFDNNLIVSEKILGIDGELLGYFILSKNLNDIEQTDLNTFKLLLIMFVTVLILLIFLFAFYIRNKEKSEIIKANLELESGLNEKLNEQIKIITEEKNLNRNILDAQPNLVILSDGKALIDANKSTFELIAKKYDMDNFIKEQKCICDYFVDVDEIDYIHSKYIEGKTWLEYITQNSDFKYKCAIMIGQKLHHYKISAKYFNYFNKNIFIVSLNDITHEVEIAQALKEEMKENKKKDMLLLQQSRLAAMGEMIGNIAHQWRQPLSAITSAISGLKLKQEYGILEDNDIVHTSDDIIKSANFLSKTIDDFRNFFKKDKIKEDFYIDDVIYSTFDIIKASYLNNLIDIDFDMEHIQYKGYPTELSQVFLNILSNAKDALLSSNVDYRYVKISLKTTKDNIIISIMDNGGGIKDEIIEKIFDPYFTTKHQSLGTGLGLYMSSQIIKASFKGSIYAQNDNIEFQSKQYVGANFIIELPLLVK